MSHRIAGPVYVLGRDLRLLAEGRYPERRSLRRGDELKELFALFGDAVEALRRRDERRTAAIEEALRGLRPAVARAPELRGAVDALEAEIRDRAVAPGEAGAASAAGR
jgi:hypothetical protein